MTADERIERLLNRFGQTIGDLPNAYNTSSVEDVVMDWYDGPAYGKSDYDYYLEGCEQYICHLADIIDRMEIALETARNWATCSLCQKNNERSVCDQCSQCDSYEPENHFVIRDDLLHDQGLSDDLDPISYALQAAKIQELEQENERLWKRVTELECMMKSLHSDYRDMEQERDDLNMGLGEVLTEKNDKLAETLDDTLCRKDTVLPSTKLDGSAKIVRDIFDDCRHIIDYGQMHVAILLEDIGKLLPYATDSHGQVQETTPEAFGI